jgi:hypothetical protein
MHWVGIFIAFVAAIGVGTIVGAIVSHLTAISNFRQAWINALRDDLAKYFKALEDLNFIITEYLKDSAKNEDRKAKARTKALVMFERIRLRLNRTEDMHIQLEKKLREFIDQPLGQAMAERVKIDEAVELARIVLKAEWEVTKYPWKSYWKSRPAIPPVDETV